MQLELLRDFTLPDGSISDLMPVLLSDPVFVVDPPARSDATLAAARYFVCTFVFPPVTELPVPPPYARFFFQFSRVSPRDGTGNPLPEYPAVVHFEMATLFFNRIYSI